MINKPLEQSISCPTERLLWDYRSGFLSKRREDTVRQHLFHCRFCQDALLLADEALRPGVKPAAEDSPSKDSLERVISLARKVSPSKPLFRRLLWLFLSLFSIGLSFIFSRFFLQWLILGLLFGLKWVFDSATNRTLIVMYDTLKKREEASEERRRVKDKITGDLD